MRLTRLWLVVFVVVSLPAQAAVGMRAARTASVTGDEPFYLATAQSLVSDGDLDLRDEYRDPSREMDRFWGGRIPLWKQMEPAPDGRLLAPHDPGLPLLIAPAYAIGGLRGVQRFLALLWAAAMATSAGLAVRVPAGDRRRRKLLSAVTAVAIGIGAPGIVYASQVYPEGAAALCVALALCFVTWNPRSAGGMQATKRMGGAVGLALTLVALAWLGVKYVPLAMLLAALWGWRLRSDRRALAVVGAIAAIAGAHYVWWHVETFGGLTPYATNVVWSGSSETSMLADHVDVGDRLYRLHGLFIDARFGLVRWLPLTLLAIVGISRTTARYAAVATVGVLMGTFASITMMGWWFPGRMLVAGLPALVVLVAAGASRLPRVAIVLAVWSVAIGATVAWGAHHGWIHLAIDPFELGAPLAPHWLFPDFRALGAPELLVTSVWFAALAGLLWVTRWRSSCSSTGTPSRTGRSSRSRPTWRPLADR